MIYQYRNELDKKCFLIKVAINQFPELLNYFDPVYNVHKYKIDEFKSSLLAKISIGITSFIFLKNFGF